MALSSFQKDQICLCIFIHHAKKKHHNDAHFQSRTPTVFPAFSDGVNETQILLGPVQNCQMFFCLFNSGGFVAQTSVKYSQVAGDEKAEEAAAGL